MLGRITQHELTNDISEGYFDTSTNKFKNRKFNKITTNQVGKNLILGGMNII